MIKTLQIQTSDRIETIDITQSVQEALEGAADGICVVFTPHTTTGVGVNEGADPDVRRDFEEHLSRLFPADAAYHHSEGNSDAHLKSIVVGSSETLFVQNGSLLLGRWQAIYFFEFDGPRTRNVHIRFIEGS